MTAATNTIRLLSLMEPPPNRSLLIVLTDEAPEKFPRAWVRDGGEPCMAREEIPAGVRLRNFVDQQRLVRVSPEDQHEVALCAQTQLRALGRIGLDGR